MPELCPFRLEPDFRERVWGSHDLSPIYPDFPGKQPIGEVWLTSDDNRVGSGPLAGDSLGELCRRFRRELVGDTVSEVHRFPLLIKFLFPADKLSVQVHPDDEAAQRLGQACGKTECWYVVQASKEARIGLGLKPGTTRKELARAIGETRAEDLLNWLCLRAGEMIYVDAGTVHAIGPGSILVETQQNSDTTYRLYDYGRPRELHVEQGLEAVKERTNAGKVKPVLSANGLPGGPTHVNLVSSPCFAVEKYSVKREVAIQRPPGETRSVQILVAVAGGGAVESIDAPSVTLARGEAVVVPACVREFRLHPQWELECLRATLPASNVAEPVTVME